MQIRDNIKEMQKLTEDLKKDADSVEAKEYTDRFNKMLMSEKGVQAKVAGYSNQADTRIVGFPKLLSDFLDSSVNQYDRMDVRFKKSQAAYDDLVILFAEEPKNTPPDEFFGIFSKFIQSYQLAKVRPLVFGYTDGEPKSHSHGAGAKEEGGRQAGTPLIVL